VRRLERAITKPAICGEISITLDTYSHAIPAMQEEAAARIAELVFAYQQRMPSSRA
jgi:hypothetical protein